MSAATAQGLCYSAWATTTRGRDGSRTPSRGAGRAQQQLVASVEQLRSEWRERLAAPRHTEKRLRSDAAAWQVLDLLPRLLVLTGPIVASEPDQ